MQFRHGVPEAPIAEVGPAPAARIEPRRSSTGTEVTFLP